MTATLYVRPQPRAFFLLTSSHALVFRQPDVSETKASRSVVVAEFLALDDVDMRGLIKVSKGKGVEGVLGVTSVPSGKLRFASLGLGDMAHVEVDLLDRSPVPEIFLLFLSAASTLPPLCPSTSLRPARVVGVEFHSLSSGFWDPPLPAEYSAYPFDTDLDDPYGPGSTPVTTQSQASQQGIEHPCTGMKKYLESGGFFFAEGCEWDISTRLGESNWLQPVENFVSPLESFDDRFVWNSTLLAPLLTFRSHLPADLRSTLDAQNLIVPIIQGFVGSLPVQSGAASLGIISRLGWKRAGARFRTRGIDDDGQVANFVETETILAMQSTVYSYVETRASVPLFWQQPTTGLQTMQQRVEITRPPQASQPAFDKHFLDLMQHYHSVHAINLLGQKDAESMLSLAYTDHLANLKRTLDKMPSSEKKGVGTLSLTAYDFHASVKIGGHEAVKYDFASRLQEVNDSMHDFGWTAIDASSGQIIELQDGVFRVNCLDWTNYVQDVISSITLSRFLTSIDSPLLSSPTFWSAHRELWADNGDQLSKIYAGTGALNTSATRSGKKTFAGLLSDATKSVSRAYINNFQDKGKQNAIDMLLGMMAGQRQVILFDPIGDSVQIALKARVNEYSKTHNIVIFSGTWNLNGKAPDEDLDAWLFPPNTPEPDIYAIAFQEIVALTAGQILQTDPTKRRIWEAFIKDTFIRRKGDSEYILLRSEQLVGTALIVMVRASLAKTIRNVETATKKTGLQGLSGNKGGVGIRLDLYDSSVCLMTCHLAAGHANVAERNADYKTISGGMRYLRGKSIDDHEIAIWGADFNYRVNLPNIDVREYAEAGVIDPLLACDQKLLQAVGQGEVFIGYDEGPIAFRPTYKYDNGTDEYDTSEKARIPAWTDRILFKGSSLRLKEYNRAELVTSDHRPVYAVFDATIREVDHAKKEVITKGIIHSLRHNSAGGEKLDAKVEKSLNGAAISPTVSPLLPSASPKLPPRPNSRSTKPSMLPVTPILEQPPTITPTVTGDFVVIPSARRPAPPPPLPPRSVPSPQTSLNVDSTIPNGLAPPAVPDVVTSPPKKKAPPPLPPKPGNLKSASTAFA
ncbi:synaptojanin, partial [Tremellales sp. Uapishka_1]